MVQLKQSQLLQMDSRQAELESHVQEMTQLHEKEREFAKNQEQLLRGKVSQLSLENKQLEGDKTGRMTRIRFGLHTCSSLSLSLSLLPLL